MIKTFQFYFFHQTKPLNYKENMDCRIWGSFGMPECENKHCSISKKNRQPLLPETKLSLSLIFAILCIQKYGKTYHWVDHWVDHRLTIGRPSLPSPRHKLGNHGFTTEAPTAAAFLDAISTTWNYKALKYKVALLVFIKTPGFSITLPWTLKKVQITPS